MALDDAIRQQHAINSGLALSPGRAVLDSITGARGTVSSGRVEHRVIPRAQQRPTAGQAIAFNLPDSVITELYQVRLDDGSTVERARAQLVELPAGLAVDLEEFHP